MTLKHLEINGVKLNNILLGDEYVYSTSEVELGIDEIEGKEKDLVRSVGVKGVEVSIPIVYVNYFNKNLVTYNEAIDEIIESIGFGREEVEVSFTGDDYYRVGYFQGTIEIDPVYDIQGTYSFELSFRMTENKRYSLGKKEVRFTGAETSIVVDNGGEEVQPFIKLEAMRDVQYLAIRNLTTGEVFALGENINLGAKRGETKVVKIGNDSFSYVGKGRVILEGGVLKPKRV